MNATAETAGVLAPPPFIYGGALAVGFGLEALLSSPTVPGSVRWPLGALVLAGGLLLSLSFALSFRRARTPIDVARPTTALVTTGPYRFSRNPGYVSLALIYTGIVLLASALWALVPLVPALIVVEFAVIRREERYLERRFGADYQRYMERTRRWL